MWLDLRLLGLAMREAPVTDVIEQLEPWAIGGFAVMFVSGSLLILSEPLKCYNTVAFRIKVVLLILAALNVLYFHKRVMHNVDDWDRNMPWRAKMVGILSLDFVAGRRDRGTMDCLFLISARLVAAFDVDGS